MRVPSHEFFAGVRREGGGVGGRREEAGEGRKRCVMREVGEGGRRSRNMNGCMICKVFVTTTACDWMWWLPLCCII